MRCEYVAADVLQLRQPLQQKRESVGLGAEAARGNGRESDGGGTQGKKRKEADDATQRATDFVSCSVLGDAREREFFRSGQTITGCHKCFQPGTLSSFITLRLQFFFLFFFLFYYYHDLFFLFFFIFFPNFGY
jgi:hypothetical protein